MVTLTFRSSRNSSVTEYTREVSKHISTSTTDMQMPKPPRSATFLTLFWLSAILVHAQDTSGVCLDSLSNTYNASSEKTVDGFYSNRTYSFFTAVKQVLDYETNQSTVLQNYWLRADPVLSTSWQDLPFGGCLFILSQQATSNLQPNSMVDNPEGVTTCESVLPNGCNEAWIRQLNDSVISLSRSQLNNTWQSCQALNLTMPYECRGAFYNNSEPIPAFGAPVSGIPSMISGEACSDDINIFNGSSTQNTYARDGQIDMASALGIDLNTTIGNNTVYDYFVRRTNAIFMAAWPRWPGSETNFTPVVNSVCLCPEEHILNNSKDPVNGASPAVKNTPHSMLLLLFIMAAIGLIAG